MSYEIPSKLQYKEQIVFGLDFEQLAYALVLLPVAVALFAWLPFSFYVRLSFALVPIALAVLLMFFKFKEWAFSWLEFYKFRKSMIVLEELIKAVLTVFLLCLSGIL